MDNLERMREGLARREADLADLDAQLSAIAKSPEKSGRRSLTPDQTKRFGELHERHEKTLEEIDEIKAGIAELELYLERRENARKAGATWDPKFDRAARGTSEVRGAALRHIEGNRRLPDAFRAGAVKVIESDDSDAVAAVAAVSADPDYLTAWVKIAADPQRGHMTWSPGEHAAFARAKAMQDRQDTELRAMSVGTNSAGGYMVPFILDPSVVITGAGAINPIRQRATTRFTAANNWHGVTAAQVSASWDTEASAVSDDTPTFTQPSIPVYLARAFVPMSFEAFDDISNLVAELGTIFADAKANLEVSAFATGTGSAQPKGVVTAVGAVTASRVSPTTGGTYGLPDIYLVQNALPARHSQAASWMSSLTVINKTRRFGEGTTGSNSAFWADLGSGQPPQLLGRPYDENSGMTTTITTGNDVLIYGNFAKYYVVDHVGGSRTEFLPNLLDQATGRPSSQRGLMLWWRSGADVVDADAFRLLRC